MKCEAVCVDVVCGAVVSGGRRRTHCTRVHYIRLPLHWALHCHQPPAHRRTRHPEEELLSSRRRRHFEPRTPAQRAAQLQPVCSIWVKACRAECSGTLQLVISFLLFQNASKDFGVLESFEQSQD